VIQPRLLLVLVLCVPLAASPAQAVDALTLTDGDRVVLVGSALIEREQRYGYWETALTRRHPDKSITFRNLGWSGDSVFGDARAGFGTQADGFRHLKEHVLALKPTVLIIGYGTNESFEGPKGLPRFVKGLETLLDTFAPTKARIVLLSPLKQENLGPPLPDPMVNNKCLRLYADAIRDVAKKRGHLFVDLFDLLGNEKHPLTEDGIHLTAWGYGRSAPVLERALGLPEMNWHIEMNAKGEVEKAIGARVTTITTEPLRIKVSADLLPLAPSPPDGAPPSFPAEEPQLKVEGHYIRAGADPDREQAERLRQTIVAKNRLYFYRWRPENETYLFGFRKHEQGQNAREIPQFDPLIAEKEKEIAKLRVPVSHTYELKAEKKP
jgi:lysophospholipase L1-like esterase